MKARAGSVLDAAFRPVDPSSLAVFRVAFGLVLATEGLRFLLAGWGREYYVDPSFHFTYWGFGWVRPWPAWGMDLHFVVLSVASLLVALGLRYRLAAVVVFLSFSYVFLLEKSRYLNHFYLVIVLAFWLVFLPAHHGASIDARRRGGARPVPAWAVAALRIQIGLVYLHAGIAKLNADWLRAEPLTTWLEARRERFAIGWILAQDWVAWTFSYGGLLLDLFAWPLLARRATRVPAFVVITLFHLTNAVTFGIGIFPWLMIAATTIFFQPDWPRRLLGRGPREWSTRAPAPARRVLVVGACALLLALQALIPVRHLLYPGSVHWTEEGHAFSWHMKLRTKRGFATFVARNVETGEDVYVDPASELPYWQYRKMAGRPDMLLQYAHHIAERMRGEGWSDVAVHAHVQVSLNSRSYAPLVDPEVDLARVPRGLAHWDWILPLELPLRSDGVQEADGLE